MNWRGAAVAPSGTHHVRDGTPLYDERFDEVLTFHEPGLAAVRRDGRAWHIGSDGEPAYRRRFDRTFGFYEGLAAAAAPDGWRHVRPDGADLYETRYAWCGNFQDGRCAAREPGGAYLHLTAEGVPANDARWRYAGDFRDGVAVVQSDDGRSTHIDLLGAPIHGARFLDLDVFHKGFARARDEDGWMHVDTSGRPLYQKRFAAVEPFYNGQARVERLDGGLEVIDETGVSIMELRPALKSEFAALSDELTGFWRTQAICAAVELGVFETLPASAAGLARAFGLKPDRTRRLLRALAELRLAEYVDGMWRTTGRGAFLAAGHPWTLADAAVEYGRFFPAMWEPLPRALRGNEEWRPPDIFGEIAADPGRVATHHRMLASYALHDYGPVADVLDLSGDERVIDAGGGLGALAGLLVEAYPQLRVTVLDRPEVVERAARLPQPDRVTFRAGDLFEPWDVEGDAVILARVLHDWDNGPALRLLRQAHRTLPSGGRVFAVEMVLSEDGAAGGLCDLHLLAVTGGRERTACEYAALLDQAGFVHGSLRQLPGLTSVVVGIRK
ncbi:MAG: methyltransferase domain-containing protein [Rhodospirillaceae bacterium]|nr:methyltransferase domain-containing protein [Rhodospirillaceae bacterium]MYB13661.1 methyltransferase domain-containing protein [Rhodospirillaceae bacterium]MYI50938.1 methyltransferase domain-containing protein [Rhodospirillaceae bacterium]